MPGPPGIPQAPDSQPPLMQEDAGLELCPTEKEEIWGSRLLPWQDGQEASCDP